MQPVMSDGMHHREHHMPPSACLRHPLCSILYQRGIYPEDTFKQKPYHGLSVHVSSDKELAKYLDTVMGQMQGGLLNSAVSQPSAVFVANKQMPQQTGCCVAAQWPGYVFLRITWCMAFVANCSLCLLLTCRQCCAVAAWLEQGTLQRVVMVVTNAATQEVVERWTFSVETDAAADG